MLVPILKRTHELTMNYGATNSARELVTNGAAAASSHNGWFPDSHLEVIMLTSVILNSMAGGVIFIFSKMRLILVSKSTLNMSASSVKRSAIFSLRHCDTPATINRYTAVTNHLSWSWKSLSNAASLAVAVLRSALLIFKLWGKS